jgi:APA family basic amino acid/polyamine antiporter
VIACIAIIPARPTSSGVIYAFGAMLSFTIAHAAVIDAAVQAARRDGRGAGPARAIRGRELPLFAIFGGLGTGIALIVATVLDTRVLISGVGWLALGITLYVVYRRRQGCR